MNARQFTNALKAPSGRMVLFVLGLILAVAVIAYFSGGPSDRKKTATPERPSTGRVASAVETTSYSLERPFSPARTGRASELQRPDGAHAEPDGSGQTQHHVEQRLGIQVYAEPVSASGTTQGPAMPPEQTVSPDERYAEDGRLLWCELSFAVENSSFETPIIGRVVKDLYWHGKLIVPEGTQVLGKAKAERVRDRIGASNEWTLVLPEFEGLPHGGALVVRAIVTDRIMNDPKADGRPGLHGTLLSASSTKDEIEFFAANMVVGATNGLTPQQQTVYGSQIVPGVKSALFQAIGTSAERYADRIFEIIRQEGFYVAVPAGKAFYLFVDQPILLREAKVGGTLAFHPTAVAENELRRAGLLKEERKPSPEETPAPESTVPDRQLLMPSAPPLYVPDESQLRTTTNPVTK